MKILITGTAGFIGHHCAVAFAEKGYTVTGIDNLNAYYDPALKLARLAEQGFDTEAISEGTTIRSGRFPRLSFAKVCLEDENTLQGLFETERFDFVCHLAAQAGVRYSLENPSAYIQSNIVGFLNILENCRRFPVKHLVFASSSSVYGLNRQMPFSTSNHTDHPVSLYAATKKSNEMMAHSYAHLYGIPSTGLRFFTVYGPWGRPDMAPFLFTDAAFSNRPIDIFNNGEMERDFTYIDDIVESIVRMMPLCPSPDPEWDPFSPDPARSSAPYRLYNIGNSQPVKLMDFICEIERASGKTIEKIFKPMQPGDVRATFADVNALETLTNFRPHTPLKHGINAFVSWFRHYYHTDHKVHP